MQAVRTCMHTFPIIKYYSSYYSMMHMPSISLSICIHLKNKQVTNRPWIMLNFLPIIMCLQMTHYAQY